MPYTKDETVITQALVDLLDASKVTLGLAAVYYGNQGLIPTFPSAECQTGPKNRTYRNTRQYTVAFSVDITVMFGKVQSAEINIKGTEELCEAIEDVLHEDKSLGDLVYDSYVRRIVPGVVLRETEMIKAARINWIGESVETF